MTLRDGVRALPQLLEALEKGAGCAIDTAPIIARAHALAARQEGAAPGAEGGETTAALRVSATGVAQARVQPAAAEPPDADPSLREIFSRKPPPISRPCGHG